MTNCEFCLSINDKIKEKDSDFYRCKKTGLRIKKWEIPDRCEFFQISELGVKKQEEQERDRIEEEKFWRDRYECGKDNIPEELLNKFIAEDLLKKK